MTGGSCSSSSPSRRCSLPTSSASASRRSRADHDYTLPGRRDLAEELVRRDGRRRAGLRRRPRHRHLGRERADGPGPRRVAELRPGGRAPAQRLDGAGRGQPHPGPAPAPRPRSGRSSRGSPTSASSAISSARSSRPSIRSATRRPPTSGPDLPTTAAAARPQADPLHGRAHQRTPSAGTERSATGPEPLSICLGHGSTRWPPRRCSTRSWRCVPQAPVTALGGPRPLPADRGSRARRGRARRRAPGRLTSLSTAVAARRYNAALARAGRRSDCAPATGSFFANQQAFCAGRRGAKRGDRGEWLARH